VGGALKSGVSAYGQCPQEGLLHHPGRVPTASQIAQGRADMVGALLVTCHVKDLRSWCPPFALIVCASCPKHIGGWIWKVMLIPEVDV